MEITKGLKIVHMTNWAPGKSGMYESTEELMYEERRLGYNAKIVDVVPYNPLRLGKEKDHYTLKEGLVKGIEDEDWSSNADILCWHRYMPEAYFSDARKNLVLFLHGQPDFVFYQEADGKDKAYSLIKGVYNSLPQCQAFIGMWKDHDKGYWNHLLPGKLVTTDNPWMNLDKISMNSDKNFDPNHIKLVCFDTWRSTKDPFYIINAVKILADMHMKGELPFKVTLDLFGQDPKTIKKVYIVSCEEYINKYIFFRGYGYNQEIFDNFDISLTTGSEETRIIRESLCAGMPLIVGETHCQYTDYKAPFRAPHIYAQEIIRLCNDIRDEKKRKAIMEKNRKYAFENFDIKKNIAPVIEVFEKIVKESKAREYIPEYWNTFPEKAESKCKDKNYIIDCRDDFNKKILNCTISTDFFKEHKNVDKYNIKFEDIVVTDKESEYITDYKLNETYPENYFDYIYIDYLDLLPQNFKDKFIKYINKIKKKNGNLIYGELKEVEIV